MIRGRRVTARTARVAALIATALLVQISAAALPAAPSPAPEVARRSGPDRPTGPVVSHGAGASRPHGSSARSVARGLDHPAIEPTLGHDPSGNIFYAAAGFGGPGGLVAGTDVMRSGDGGETWEIVSPRVLGQNAMPITGDPYVYVDDRTDGDTARVFTIDLTLACSYMSFSDDGGRSWITNPLSCGRPVNDHQTLFSGPPVSSQPIGYPNIVYYCWNDIGTSSCSRSLDGGLTFVPTGQPAFMGYEAGGGNGFYGVDGFCGGLHGHGAVDGKGTIYLPRELCGRPMLAISKDEGASWGQVQVSDLLSTAQAEEGASHPSVAVDDAGNLYYLWVAKKDRLPYLSISTDGGSRWSDPMMVGAPGIAESNLPQIDAIGKGEIAFVYYGAPNSPFTRCGSKCTVADYQHTIWNGYLAISDDILSRRPRFLSGRTGNATDPMVRGFCEPGACQWVLDFIDVEIGPDGKAYGAFVDSCIEPCFDRYPAGQYEGQTLTIKGGPRLR